MSRRRIIIIDNYTHGFWSATGTERIWRETAIHPNFADAWDGLSTSDWNTIHAIMGKDQGTWTSGDTSNASTILNAMANA